MHNEMDRAAAASIFDKVSGLQAQALHRLIREECHCLAAVDQDARDGDAQPLRGLAPILSGVTLDMPFRMNFI